MASSFGLSVQKTVRRAKEKVLQNIGKADKTPDEAFEILVANFNKQQTAALRLQKEVKAYANELKAVSSASTNLYAAIGDLYEDDWHHSFEIKSRTEAVPLSWQTCVNHLHEDIVQPLNDYCAKFADMKARIAKRNRKLIDYDSARHTLADLQTSKTPNQSKISKAEMELREKQQVFEEINDDLQRALPHLYQERVAVLSASFFNIFNNDAHLGEEITKVNSQLARMVEQRQSASDVRNASNSSSLRQQGGKNDSLPRYSDSPIVKRVEERSDDENSDVGKTKRRSFPDDNYESIDVSSAPEVPKYNGGKATADVSQSTAVPMSDVGLSAAVPVSNYAESHDVIYSEVKRVKSTLVETKESTHNGQEKSGAYANEGNAYANQDWSAGSKKEGDGDLLKRASGGQSEQHVETDSSRASAHKESPSPAVQSQPQLQQAQQHYQTPVASASRAPSVHEAVGQSGDDKPAGGNSGNAVAQQKSNSIEQPTYQVPVTTSSNSPSPFLYKVQAIHAYAAEDMDELNLDIGDIVGVIPFPDPDDQDDGWLMGVKLSTGQKGVLPANFTARVS